MSAMSSSPDVARHWSEFKQSRHESGDIVSSGNAVWRNCRLLVVIADGLMA
jgi:hypothetical protein